MIAEGPRRCIKIFPEVGATPDVCEIVGRLFILILSVRDGVRGIFMGFGGIVKDDLVGYCLFTVYCEFDFVYLRAYNSVFIECAKVLTGQCFSYGSIMLQMYLHGQQSSLVIFLTLPTHSEQTRRRQLVWVMFKKTPTYYV